MYLPFSDHRNYSDAKSHHQQNIKHLNKVCVPSVHMTSIASVNLGRGILLYWSPEGFFAFFPVKGFFEVLGQGCRMCTDCKALWGKFLICDVGLYKINWIELNKEQRKSFTLFMNKCFQLHAFAWSQSDFRLSLKINLGFLFILFYFTLHAI